MRPILLLCCLLLTAPAYARLGETTAEIAIRYGNPLKGVKPESPATVAGLYQKNGFQITIGFYDGKAYYEQFRKLDPQKPNSFQKISQTEQELLLKANCKGCDWTGHHTDFVTAETGIRNPETSYDRSDGLATALYNENSRVLVVRSLAVEKKRAAEEKTHQQENLKEF